MRVAFVTDTYPPDVNGVAMTLERLVGGMVERGHQVALVSTLPLARDNNPDGAIVTEWVPSIPLPGYTSLRLGIPSPKQITRFIRRWKPEVMYVATESALGYSSIRAANKEGVPVLSGFHTNFHSYLEDYHLPMLENVATRYLRALHNKTLCTFTPSMQSAAALEAKGFERVKVLGRGVDTTLFHPGRRRETLRAAWGAADPATPVALFVGRIAAEKNLPLCVHAFEELRQQRPGMPCVFVGDGPRLQSLRGDHPEFIYAGMQHGTDLAAHYASADLFIFPSLSETYGNVLVEALASGLVTVSFNYAAAQQHIRHGANGLVATMNDADDFIRQCQAALQQWLAGESVPMREAALATAAELSWDRVLSQLERELQRTLPHAPAVGRSDPPAPAAGIADQAILSATDSPPPERPAPREPAAAEAAFLIPPADTPEPPLEQVITEVAARGKTPGKRKLRVKTVFISDVHLGTADCQINQVNHFLRHVRCEKLVLNGDIIDGWSLSRSGKWNRGHTYFVRLILKKMEKESTEVIYIRGNHDDILTKLIPLKLDNLSVVREHVHDSPHGRYLVVHGDGFDAVTTHYRWLAMLGAVGYETLLRINRVWNAYRKWRGKPHFSLSKAVKGKVKSAVSWVGRYEEQLQKFATQRDCQGIICGHIHTPADKHVGDTHYLNSGDWVESLTAVVEHLDRSFEVVTYEEFCRRTHRSPKDGRGLGSAARKRAQPEPADPAPPAADAPEPDKKAG